MKFGESMEEIRRSDWLYARINGALVAGVLESRDTL